MSRGIPAGLPLIDRLRDDPAVSIEHHGADGNIVIGGRDGPREVKGPADGFEIGESVHEV